MGLCQLDLKTKNSEEALKDFKKAWDISAEMEDIGWQIGRLVSKADVHLEMKSMEEAKKTADELKDLLEKQINKKLMRIYFSLIGRISCLRKIRKKPSLQ